MKKMFIIMMMCVSLVFTGVAFAGDVGVDSKSEAVSGSMIDDHSVNTFNTYDRKFVNQGVYPFPQTNGFFVAPTPDSSFRSVKELLKFFHEDNIYMIRISEGALEELADGARTKTHVQIVRGELQVPRFYNKDYEGEKWLWLGIEEPVFNEDNELLGTKRIPGCKVTGMIDSEAKNGTTNSFQIIGLAGLKALKDGNNIMIITAEGAHRMTEATGWGVGSAVTGGLVNQSGKESLAGGGGTGYTNNKTLTEDKPWIQAYVGVNPTYEVPVIATPVVVKEKQTHGSLAFNDPIRREGG